MIQDIFSHKCISIIGMAKNSGKTVTLNYVIKKAAEQGKTLAVLSFGRDGEKIDLITNKKKPRIFIPPGCFFVTTDRVFNKCQIEAELIQKTGYKTMVGEVNIYKTRKKGGYCELAGVNCVSQVRRIKEMIEDRVDLLLIDGALDRRSSAIFSDGFILATGAVVGNTAEIVVEKTLFEIQRLTLPELQEPGLLKIANGVLEQGRNAIISKDNEADYLSSETSLVIPGEVGAYLKSYTPRAIILGGAVTDSIVKELLRFQVRDCLLIAVDGTKIFVSSKNLKLLEKNNIKVMVLHSLDLIAVTVNPTNPDGEDLDSELLVDKLRERLRGILVCDLMKESILERM